MVEMLKIWTLPGCADVELIHAGSLRSQLPPQVSLACKLVYLEQGARRFQYGRRRQIACTGDLLLIPPGEVHGVEFPVEPCAVVRVLSVGAAVSQAADELRLPCDELRLPYPLPHYRQDPFIADGGAVAAFLRLHHDPSALKTPMEAQSLLLTLLERLSTPGGPEPPRSEPAAVRRAKQFLEDRHAENISLAHLAQAVDLAPSYLCRVFKRSVGMPPHAYLVAVRIARARMLLRRGVTAGQAAQETGFYDQAHFTRAFTRSLQIPPMEYARQVRR